MKYQKVSVDVWSMLQTMVSYLGVVLLGGLFLRLLVAVVTLPRRFHQQRESVDKAIKDLQERYPDCFNQAMEEMGKEEGKEGEKGEEKGEEEKKTD